MLSRISKDLICKGTKEVWKMGVACLLTLHFINCAQKIDFLATLRPIAVARAQVQGKLLKPEPLPLMRI